MSLSTSDSPKKQEPEELVTDVSRRSSTAEGELFREADHVLHHNTAVFNHAIEQLGFGRYQWQLFFTCGFGFLVDQVHAFREPYRPLTDSS